jgi:hypothetical protein
MKDHIGTKTELRWVLAVGLLLALAGRGSAEDWGPATERAAAPAAESDESTPAVPPSAETIPASPPAPAPAAAPPRTILIESLDVEGTKREGAKRVVLSESRLVAGGEYTEQEIARAARRVKRLPFILDARPALRRGSTPGQYRLVFIIEEHSALRLGLTGDHWSDGMGSLSTGLASPSFERFLGPLTQVRLSVDTGASRVRSFYDSNEPEVRDTPLRTVVALGFTRYDIAGTASRLDVTVRAGRELCRLTNSLPEVRSCNEGMGWGLSGSLLVPFDRDNSLSLSVGLQSARETNPVEPATPETAFMYRLPSAVEYESRWLRGRFNLTWVHDTTDDPVAPLEGTRSVVGGGIWVERWDYKDYPYTWGPIFDDGVGGTLMLRVQHFLPLWRGFTLSAGAAPLAGFGSGGDGAYGEASLGLRWVHAGRRNRHRLSLESGLIGVAGGAPDSHHWIPYSSLRFRSGLIVIALDARWAR